MSNVWPDFIYVHVDNDVARDLVLTHVQHASVVAVDSETVGVNPRIESPGAGHGRVHLFSLAWRVDGVINAATIPQEYLADFAAWLAGPVPKVGHYLLAAGDHDCKLGFDAHVFANSGAPLGGIYACSKAMARLVYPSRDIPCGLKPLLESEFGIITSDFADTFRRVTCTRVETRDGYATSQRSIGGIKVPTLLGLGEVHHVSFARRGQPLAIDEALAGPARAGALLYAAKDAVGHLVLFERLRDKLVDIAAAGPYENFWALYRKLWHKALLAIYDMERVGIGFSAAGATRIRCDLTRRIEDIEDELAEWAPGVNLASPKQLAVHLYDTLRLGVPKLCGTKSAVKRTRKGKRPTDQVALAQLVKTKKNAKHRPQLARLAEHKDAVKLRQFVDALPTHLCAKGRLHSQFAPDTETGRLSSKRPALQQIPERLRPVFRPRRGHLVIKADQSQLELRILAHLQVVLCGDHTLVLALAGDVHSFVTRLAFPQLALTDDATIARDHSDYRKRSKAITYGLAYGKTKSSLANQLAITQDEAQVLLDRVKIGLGLAEVIDRLETLARESGRSVTLFGRYRVLPYAGWQDGEDVWKHYADMRKAVNSVVQGSAHDVMTVAMVHCAASTRLRELGCVCVLQVHDELVFEVPEANAVEACAIVRELMERPGEHLRAPLVVDAEVKETW